MLQAGMSLAGGGLLLLLVCVCWVQMLCMQHKLVLLQALMLHCDIVLYLALGVLLYAASKGQPVSSKGQPVPRLSRTPRLLQCNHVQHN
jgi:hypothetical protein